MVLGRRGKRFHRLSKGVVETMYDFMVAMADVIPRYKLHWLGNLITLADERWKLEIDGRKREALKMEKWRWQEFYHTLKAETTSMASPYILLSWPIYCKLDRRLGLWSQVGATKMMSG
ncbi:hypothetical protein ACJ73_01924 [Blastomyces percursus]|uniref:Uncharacterized protein n=1 Tax=Blastomyces percursus TaxID=1658174 RepID=A0A1J9RGC5_9EURO|nr:hypothetical protein ACJ73_01924 [Blastomyces percursus]